MLWPLYYIFRGHWMEWPLYYIFRLSGFIKKDVNEGGKSKNIYGTHPDAQLVDFRRYRCQRRWWEWSRMTEAMIRVFQHARDINMRVVWNWQNESGPAW
jgi:hypothetical protein